jgi:hypothetical protein
MRSRRKEFAADQHYLLETVARRAGFADPVAVELEEFYTPLLKAARRGPFLPIDGVLVRDWDPDERRTSAGIQLGARLYTIDTIRFARVVFNYDQNLSCYGHDFFVVGRADYRQLYRVALRCRRDAEPPSQPPIL